jgi:hypothetical protein
VRGVGLASREGFGVRRRALLCDPVGQQLGQRPRRASRRVVLMVLDVTRR